MPLNVNTNQYQKNYKNNNLCFQQEEKKNKDETNKFNESLFNNYISINENFTSKADVNDGNDNENKNYAAETVRNINYLDDSNKTDIVSNYLLSSSSSSSLSSSSYRIRKLPAKLVKANLYRVKINKKMSNFRMKKIFKLILNYFLLFVFILMIYLVIVQAYILFQNTVRRSDITSLYRNPKFSNDFSSNELIQKISTNDENISNKEFQSEMDQIKTAINKLYSSIENPIDFCPIEPTELDGELNVIDILDKFNLTNLVEFHDNKTYNTTSNQYIKNELYYVNGFNISDKNVSSRDIEFYNLWHSNDLKVLNISNLYLGDDGSRVELGKIACLVLCLCLYIKLNLKIIIQEGTGHQKIVKVDQN